MISHREAIALSNKIENLCKQHEDWRGKRCINLIPSENTMSSKARALLSSDFTHRYTSREKYYMGTRFIDEVEQLATELAKKVFKAKFADLRPISGHLCDMAICLMYSKRGDKMLSVSPNDGGYPGFSERGLGGVLGLKNVYFPFDKDRMNIDEQRTIDYVKKEKPNITFFGASFFLFPHPVKKISKALDSMKIYDGSHVLGLLAGSAFQSPLDEGCDILLGSTHKSFFGPQGGIIVTNNGEIADGIDRNLHPGIVDNLHWNRILALAMVLVEMLRFGREYATQVVRNSKALASALSDLKVKVCCKSYGFTESHQVLLTYSKGRSSKIAETLQRGNIIVDRGIRLGTSEVTRRGMKEEEMQTIAHLIAEGMKNPDAVKKKAEKLAREFSDEEYCL
jgi:glycine hydroxymethyltransferase